jgi:hypothetical protein
MLVQDMLGLFQVFSVCLVTSGCQVSSGGLVISAYIKLCHVRPGNFRLGLDMHFITG